MKVRQILIWSVLICSFQITLAQTIQVKKIDFRGQRAQKAFVAAHSASKKEIIVIMVRGGSQALVEQTEKNIKGLIQSGYSRIGLVVSDRLPEDESPTIAILSKGFTYAAIENAHVSAKINLHFYQLVRDVYKEDILSQLH